MKYQIKQTNRGFLVNFGGTNNFGPVTSAKEAEALATLFLGLVEAQESVAYDREPTPEETLKLFNKMLNSLK